MAFSWNAFTWDRRFVLRRVNEVDPYNHHIYKHSAYPSEITTADNNFGTADQPVPTVSYEAVRVEPFRSWLVTLGQQPPVLMGVFQLRRRT